MSFLCPFPLFFPFWSGSLSLVTMSGVESDMVGLSLEDAEEKVVCQLDAIVGHADNSLENCFVGSFFYF